jgi:hypothetical protein
VEVSPDDEAIVAACRANLIACVDGGAVDTCWRERAQWTGDLRMSTAALGALTQASGHKNSPPVHFAGPAGHTHKLKVSPGGHRTNRIKVVYLLYRLRQLQ